MTEIRIGLIGASGWMGKTHALAYQSHGIVFPDASAQPVLAMVADVDADLARQSAVDYGAARWTADWRDVIDAPDIDLIDIVTPNNLHHEMAMAAIRAGKHVYCEKPLAMDATETGSMAALAREARVVSFVGFNYPHNPTHAVAREIIAAGELGDLRNVRFSKHTDSFSDPTKPFSWRCDSAVAGTGTIGDSCSHVFSFLDYFGFTIEEVFGNLRTVVERRPVIDAQGNPTGESRAVETDDEALFLCRFESGATGAVDASRVGTGRKNEFSYSIVGTKGALAWSYDRLNELQFYNGEDPENREGFKRIEIGPAHPTYGAFYPLAGLGMGYNDHKLIEVHRLLEAVSARQIDAWPSFAVGHRVQRYIDAVVRSNRDQRWVRVAEIDSVPG